MDRAVVLLTVAAAATPLAAAEDEARGIAETLLGLETAAMERWRAGDPMGWAEISAPEVTYVDPGLAKPIVGREAYAAYLEKLKGQIRYQGSEFLRPRVAVFGDVAVLTYNYRSTADRPGARPLVTNWNTTEVYARFGSAWRIIHTHWSFLDHEAPPSLELPVTVETATRSVPGVPGELMALESAAMARYRRGDPFGFTDISAPGVTYFDTRTPQRLDGIEALKAEMARRAGLIRYEAMEFLDPMVQVHGDTAVLFYRFLSTNLQSDGAVDRRVAWNCTEVFTRIGGVWRIVHTHWSLINGQPRTRPDQNP